VVEDDSTTRELLRRTLEACGFLVSEASNGIEGIARLEQATPAIILLDLLMPGMDGFEFLEAIREQPEWQAVPVVVITCADLSAQDRARLNGGVEHILQKSAHSREELLVRVRDLISRRLGRTAPVVAEEAPSGPLTR
jgi:CheY-like chemotaxis protein